MKHGILKIQFTTHGKVITYVWQYRHMFGHRQAGRHGDPVRAAPQAHLEPPALPSPGCSCHHRRNSRQVLAGDERHRPPGNSPTDQRVVGA